MTAKYRLNMTSLLELVNKGDSCIVAVAGTGGDSEYGAPHWKRKFDSKVETFDDCLMAFIKSEVRGISWNLSRTDPFYYNVNTRYYIVAFAVPISGIQSFHVPIDEMLVYPRYTIMVTDLLTFEVKKKLCGNALLDGMIEALTTPKFDAWCKKLFLFKRKVTVAHTVDELTTLALRNNIAIDVPMREVGCCCSIKLVPNVEGYKSDIIRVKIMESL
jgi:hypothetical protein